MYSPMCLHSRGRDHVLSLRDFLSAPSTGLAHSRHSTNRRSRGRGRLTGTGVARYSRKDDEVGRTANSEGSRTGGPREDRRL